MRLFLLSHNFRNPWHLHYITKLNMWIHYFVASKQNNKVISIFVIGYFLVTCLQIIKWILTTFVSTFQIAITYTKRHYFIPISQWNIFNEKQINWFGNDLVPKTCLIGFGDAIVEVQFPKWECTWKSHKFPLALSYTPHSS